jgi:hypothetical protein
MGSVFVNIAITNNILKPITMIQHTYPSGRTEYIDENDLCKCKKYLKLKNSKTCIACEKFIAPDNKPISKKKKNEIKNK